MRVDEPDLGDKIVDALRALDAEADGIREAMGRTVARNLQLMARMGVYFEDADRAALPGISGAHGRAGLGRVSSAAQFRPVQVAGTA